MFFNGLIQGGISMQKAYAKKVLRLKSCESVHFFKLIDKIWKGEECAPYPLHRFFSLMRKMNADSYVDEELDLNAELLDEQEMATHRCGGTVKITQVKRLTFFGSLPSSKKWDNKEDLPDDHLLGYATIVTLCLPNKTYRTYLHEAFVQTPRISFQGLDDEKHYFFRIPNYYIHNACDIKTSLGTRNNTREFVVKGSFFTQQNDLTNVCAHAALRISINSSPFMKKLLSKKGVEKLTNKYINTILGLDFSSEKKSVGHYEGDTPDTPRKEGLTVKEIVKVVDSLGARLFVTSFIEDSSVEYDEVLYPVVESHYPSILEVQGWDIMKCEHYAHALAVMGHTLNTDRWHPEAMIGYGNYPIKKHMSVCDWVCHYIISDDNYGINVTLPSDMIRNTVIPRKNPSLHVTSVFSILPKKVTLAGYKSQKIAMDIASKLIKKTHLPNKKEYWLDQLKKMQEKKRLVCRTILKERKEYYSYIETMSEENLLTPTKKQMQYFESLPEYIWITEISIPNLYTGNKHKLGDVLINAAATEQEAENYDCFILAWFPGFIRYGIERKFEPWNVDHHIPLIRTEGKPIFEW